MMPLLFLFEQGKKTADGHLKQTRKGLRNNLFILFGLRNIKYIYVKHTCYPQTFTLRPSTHSKYKPVR